MDSQTHPGEDAPSALEQNDLQRLLKKGQEKTSGYGGMLVAALIAVVVLLGGWAVMRANAAAERQEAWSKLISARVPERYAAVADEYPGSGAAVWARVSEAKALLREGMALMYTDRDTARAKLEQAEEAAEAVVQSDTAEYQAQEQATLILATVTETLSEGDMKPAIAAYQRFVDEYPGSGQRRFAEAKVRELAEPQVAEFYAWFGKQNPTPAPPAAPSDGLGGNPFLDPPDADMTLPPASEVPAAPEGGDADGSDADETDAAADESDSATDGS